MITINNERTQLFRFDENTKKIFVVGDLHGDVETFKSAIRLWKKRKNAFLILLGDYADRGENGFEILESLKELTQNNRVVALKGNHEDYSDSGEPKFSPSTLIAELANKKVGWNDYFQNELKPLLNRLYISALFPGIALFVHGGISNSIIDKSDLAQPSLKQIDDIIWSDPTEKLGEYPNKRGRGVEFGPDVTKNILNRLDIKYIIRSHQPNLAKHAIHSSHNGSVITVSSTRWNGYTPIVVEINRKKGFCTLKTWILNNSDFVLQG